MATTIEPELAKEIGERGDGPSNTADSSSLPDDVEGGEDSELERKIERVYRYVLSYLLEIQVPNTNETRKLDWRIVPGDYGIHSGISATNLPANKIYVALWVMYFLCAAIRSNVGLALTMNTSTGDSLAAKLKLDPQQISTGLALFYVCYVLFDVPANLIMTRLSPHLWMGRVAIGVGIVGVCHVALDAAWNF